jgi:hypothetical protein
MFTGRNASQHFRYMPLTSSRAMRLLVIEPGEYDAPLSCKLMRTTLDEHPPYYALSYAWQEPRTDTALRPVYGEKIDEEEWLSISIKSPAHLRVAQKFAEGSWMTGGLFRH